MRPLLLLLTLFSLLMASAPMSAQAQPAKKPALPSVSEVRAIAEDGFVYGLPLIMNYAVCYDYFVDKSSSQYKGAWGEVHNEHRVFTYKDTAIVTPNSDTPYSMAALDLRAEPFVVTVPPVEKNRYFSVQVIDWNTFNVGYVGSRSTGNKGGSYLIAGPSWKGAKPAGIGKIIRSTTQFAVLAFRTQLFDASDMPNVEKVQAGYKVEPLSSFLHTEAPPAPPAVEFPKIDKKLAMQNFFGYLDFVLQFAPAGPDEKAIRQRLARVGIGTGKPLDPKSLPAAYKAAIAAGMKSGAAKVELGLEHVGSLVNGWHLSSAFGDRAFYHGNWLLRAVAAKAGIYGNDAIEATYPMVRKDVNGQPLDGSKHKYTLTFPAGKLPPVNAFWSVTMYDGKSQLLIKNPINRYLINSPMLKSLKKNADGSVTLYIQKDSPGPAREANWLPAPNGPIYMVMRLYWPKTQAPSILPVGRGTWAPPAVMPAR